MCAPQLRPDPSCGIETSRGVRAIGLGVALGLAACTGPGVKPATDGHDADLRPAAGVSGALAGPQAGEAGSQAGASAGSQAEASAGPQTGQEGAPVVAVASTHGAAPVPVEAATNAVAQVGDPVGEAAPTSGLAPTPVEAAPVGEPGGSQDPPLLPAVPPAPTAASIDRHAPVWELVQEHTGPVQLERLAGGVLARVDGVPHELGPDGALVAKPAIDPKSAQLVPPRAVPEGTWPGDPWRVVSLDTRASTYTSFHRWRGGNRWVAQPFAGSTRLSPEEFATYAWTPRGGLLLVVHFEEDTDAVFHRLAGKYDAPAPMPVGAGDVRGVIESVDGTLFVFVGVPGPPQARGLDILRSCKKDEVSPCERTGGAALARPEGAIASFWVGEAAVRGRRDVTAEITESATTGVVTTRRRYLVHHERDAWKLEPVPEDQVVEHLLAAADGGLWITLRDEKARKDSLWHRSDAGAWVGIDLPGRAADATGVEVAMRDDEHVWLAVNAGDHHALYATAATPRLPTP